jgi:hypothetical protein
MLSPRSSRLTSGRASYRPAARHRAAGPTLEAYGVGQAGATVLVHCYPFADEQPASARITASRPTAKPGSPLAGGDAVDAGEDERRVAGTRERERLAEHERGQEHGEHQARA